MSEHAQPQSREIAYGKYVAGKRRQGLSPISYEQFCAPFDMGYKCGRKIERRRNFNYLIKSKYGGAK